VTLDLHAAYDMDLADGRAVICEAWREGATPLPRMTVSQYADAHRVIGKGAGAEPGPWKTSRHPMQREIMDALSDHSPVRLVDLMKGAQWGGTEIGINFAAYVVDRGIDSMIVAQPVKDLARSWAGSKFEPAVDMMPSLAEKIGGQATLEKKFPGGTFWVIWANSASQLRQRTARFIFGDEIDEYPADLGGQGPALDQLSARSHSYGDRAKEYHVCTPTVAGRSAIDAGFQAGDRRYYRVKCPHCGEHQVLDVDHLQPNGTFACVANGCVIEPHHKTDMLRERSACTVCGEVPVRLISGVLADGKTHAYADECACGRVEDPPVPDGAYWCPTNPNADPTHRSYHGWTAYTPDGLGLSWQEIADRKADADADPTKRATFRNLIVGEVYEGERTEQDADEVEKLAEPGVHLGTVPPGALILTAGVDCQHDRFEVTILGHGRGQRTRLVDYAVIDGDPSRPDGFGELDEFLQQTWTKANGRALHVAALAIDGGNWTEIVAQYVKSKVGHSGQARMIKVGDDYRKQSLYLVRGRSEKKSERAVYRPAKTEVNHREKTVARSVGMWGVGTSVLKHIIFGWITSAISAKAEAERAGTDEDIDARMIRFPGGRGEAFDSLKPDPGALPPTYYKGLTCEYFDAEAKAWIKPKGARNEQLDTLVYALWASLAPAIKIDTWRESQWAALEARLEPPVDLLTALNGDDPRETGQKAKTEDVDVRAQQRTQHARQRPGGFATNW
jgi:phage terminase large subunit GpA-like protein